MPWRLDSLYQFGADGLVGHDHPEEAAVADIHATMGDYFEAERKGEQYSVEFVTKENGRIVPAEPTP